MGKDSCILEICFPLTGLSFFFFRRIFYQKNSYLSIPIPCRGYVSNSNESESLLSCPELATMKSNFTSINCKNSFTTVCTNEYTDNPPFSCSRDIYPTFITTIATAMANASGAWSVVVIAIQLLLKLRWPHGTVEFDYDESTNRFVPLNGKNNRWHHSAAAQISPAVSRDDRNISETNQYELVDMEKGHTIGETGLYQRKP